MEIKDFIWPAIFGLAYLIFIYPKCRHPEPPPEDDPYADLNDF